MRTTLMRMQSVAVGMLAVASLLVVAATRVAADDRDSDRSIGKSTGAAVIRGNGTEKEIILVESTKLPPDFARGGPTMGIPNDKLLLTSDPLPVTNRTWLGVAVEEAPEALTDQLGLEAGVGLVVTHVTPDSPAAKAGLRKNDVLVELAGQSLVHPAQLRKLVQTRKPSDEVKLVFYRAGKKQTESATLAKGPPWFEFFNDGGGFRDEMRELQRELRELPIGDAIRAYTKSLHESLGPLAAEHKTKSREEIQRSLEAVRKALQEAAQQMSNAQHSLGPAHGALKDLLMSGISLNTNATVVVRSTGKSSRTLVKTDDSGTIILIGPPNLRLTARDKDGTLVFDGEIETPEQRANVPPAVWERVEPLLDEKPPSPAAPEPPKLPAPPETSCAAGAGSTVAAPLAL